MKSVFGIRDLLVYAILALGTLALPLVHAAEIEFRPGFTFIRIADNTAATALNDFFESPSQNGNKWANSFRIVREYPHFEDGAFYNASEEKWEGPLDSLRSGGYWVYVPPTIPAFITSVDDGVEAGYHPFHSKMGITVQAEDGKLTQTATTQPSSSAKITRTKEKKTDWNVGSGVHIQQSSSNTAYSGQHFVAEVALDTIWHRYGAERAFFPVPIQANNQTIYLPDISRPTWKSTNE